MRKKNKKGSAVEWIFGSIITFYLVSVIIFTGLFFYQRNETSLVVNKYLDRALVQGQFYPGDLDDMKDELSKLGLKKEKIIARAPVSKQFEMEAAFDSNPNTFIPRGQDITINVICEEAPLIYAVNRVFLKAFNISEDNYYIKIAKSGMSEAYAARP